MVFGVSWYRVTCDRYHRDVEFSEFTSLRHETLDFGVAQKRSLLALAFLVLLTWTLQIATGFMSLGLLAYKLEVQYAELVGIIVDGTYV